VSEVLGGAFGGFFLAVAAISAITGLVMRSGASAAYAVVMLTVAALEFYGVGHGGYGAPWIQAVLIAAYLIAAVVFAFALLRTPRHAPGATRLTVALLALCVVLLVLGQLWSGWAAFYYVDPLVVTALLLDLVGLGVLAMLHEATLVPVAYVSALIGPIVGIALWSGYFFDYGVIWESLFFAGAVAVRNRAVQSERDQFERMAYRDALTGVANRRTFDEKLAQTWSVSQRARVPLAVAVIDIDFFKRYNDTHGHQAGDACLRRVAQLCAGTVRRAGDCFARYGGEEFVAILFNTDLTHAVALTETMRRAVELRGEGVTVSIGVAVVQEPAPGDTPERLVKKADAALYRAKQQGRNQVCVDGVVEPALAE
jgi:diguanylate cyclase (GGDEF)-like protein